MALDTAKNFARGTLATTHDDTDTSIDVISGDGAKFPTVPFNATWFDSSVYPDPSQDPNVEIVRVTDITSDTLTVTRAQESTSASTKSTGGSTYSLVAGLTAKVINIDLPAEYVRGAANLTTAGAIPYVSASGVLNQEATKIFWDATNDRLGIGTATPTASLHVAGSLAYGTHTTGIAQRRTHIAYYSCGVGAFEPINLTDDSQLLVNGFAYRVMLNIAGSGTVSGAVYIVTYASGAVWTVQNVSNNGLSSNHPQLRLNVAGTGLEVFHLHGSQTYQISTIVETYGTQGQTTAISPRIFGLEADIVNNEGYIRVGGATGEVTNRLQTTGLGVSSSTTAGSIYFGSDLTMRITRAANDLSIVGCANMSLSGVVFSAGDFVLSTNNKSFYGKDTAGTSILMMRMASDNTCRIGPQIATATNGHLLIYAGATESMRIVPTTFFVNVGSGQTPSALLSVNERAGTAFSTVGALSTAFLVNAGTLGTTATNELACGSIGGKAGTNAVCLGVRLYRLANGTDWSTTALGVGMDVDSSARAGAAMFFHNDKKISMGTQITAGVYTLKIAGAIADVPGLTLAATNNSGGVQSGTLSFLGSTGKDWRQFIGSSSEFIIRDSNNGRNLIRLDTGGTIGLGNNNTTTGFTVSIFDATASTGVTQVQIKAGVGQATTKLLSIYANDGTTLLHAVNASGQLITATGTPASATATGVVGTVVWDAGYIYVCIATDTWVRSPTASW